MKIIEYPEQKIWNQLVQRPSEQEAGIEEAVRDIFKNVIINGDNAIFNYTQKFDGVTLEKLSVSNRELTEAGKQVDGALQSAIRLAHDNIQKFHEVQLIEDIVAEPLSGIKCWRKKMPIERVGLYVPGGSAPLFSTVLMLGIPAKLAGCKEIILCSPPQESGNIHPAILFTAKLLGIKNIYKAGGAQAIAAMAYGTETIPGVNKIFGPGNSFVTKAKELVQTDGIAIDMPAGPSEQLVIADKSCRPAFVAADLLSQAEHGPDSQVVLATNNESVAEKIIEEINVQLNKLPREKIARKALKNSFAVVLDSLDKCVAFSNYYAPEHLILVTEKNEQIIPSIINAGSVFIGNYSPESAGDYASGTNHTLPTGGYAKNYSGLSVDSFMKTITFQEITPEGIRQIGPEIERMAAAEGLEGHKRAITLRLKELKNG